MSYKYFTDLELSCRCGECDSNMNHEFMKKLVSLRGFCDFPFIISSAYRCSQHNYVIGGADKSMHKEGRAVDIVVRGADALFLIKNAQAFGMSGVGVSQKGEARFIHLDDRSETALWSY